MSIKNDGLKIIFDLKNYGANFNYSHENGSFACQGVPPEDWTSYIYLMNVKVLSF